MNWLRNLKIRNKLLALVATAVLFMAGIGGVGYFNMSKMQQYAESIYADNLLPIKWLNEARTSFRVVEAYNLELMASNDEARKNQILADTQQRIPQNDKLLVDYEHTNLLPYETERLAKLKQEIGVYRPERTKAINLALAGQKQAAYEYYRKQAAPHLENINTLFTELTDYKAKTAEANVAEIKNKVELTNQIVLVIILLAAAVFTFIGVGITRMIANPIRNLGTLVNEAGNANLTVQCEVRSRDEIGGLAGVFNQMVRHQAAVVQTVRTAADELASGSEEMAASTEQATASVEEVARSMEQLARDAEVGNQSVLDVSKVLLELSSLIQIAKSKALSASENSGVTLDVAAKGKETVNETVARMETIKAKSIESQQLISMLDQYSKQIGIITSMITNLAEQTNLLALNAAIEAARAGESGRGFAVVADEVRKLAEQSNQGAAEVMGLVHKILDSSANAVQVMQQSRIEVEEGVASVTLAGETLENILSAVRKTVEDIDGIVQVTNDEVAASDTIVQLIHSVATIIESTAASSQEVAASAQQTSAAVETMAASAQETSAMATELKTAVEIFKL